MNPLNSSSAPDAVVFAWSLPEEPAFLDVLAQKYDDFVICLLRYPALLTVRKFVPAKSC